MHVLAILIRTGRLRPREYDRWLRFNLLGGLGSPPATIGLSGSAGSFLALFLLAL